MTWALKKDMEERERKWIKHTRERREGQILFKGLVGFVDLVAFTSQDWIGLCTNNPLVDSSERAHTQLLLSASRALWKNVKIENKNGQNAWLCDHHTCRAFRSWTFPFIKLRKTVTARKMKQRAVKCSKTWRTIWVTRMTKQHITMIANNNRSGKLLMCVTDTGDEIPDVSVVWRQFEAPAQKNPMPLHWVDGIKLSRM